MRSGADRAVRWEGFYNARDLGGLPTVSGASTRYGRLVRSADPRFITAAGWEAARDAGIRVVLDLRNPGEVNPASTPTATLGAGTFAVPADQAMAARPSDITTMVIPVDDIEDLDLWGRLNGEGLNGTPLYYRPFLNAKPERIAAVLTAIARAQGGVIFHCSAGRDRTGLISLLLLSLAGVTPEAIVADYELTFGQVAPLYRALGLEQDELDVREHLTSRGVTVSDVITSLVRDLDVAGYLAAAGLSGADIGALRSRLLLPFRAGPLGHRSPDEAGGVRPRGRVDSPGRHRVALRAEEVLELHRAPDRLVHLGVVVHEVGEAQVRAVQPLVAALPAEPDVVARHAGPAMEVVRLQPAQRPCLDSCPALGHQPHASPEEPRQLRDRRDAAGHFRCGEHRRLIPAEERGVTPGVRRAVDDDPPDVDAQPGLRDLISLHGRRMTAIAWHPELYIRHRAIV
jgi:hypothetical protein